MEEGGDETWKDMEGHHAVLCVRAFYVRAGPIWVGDSDRAVSPGELELVTSASAGEHGVVLVPAQTDDQEHMIALGDSLRKLCMAEHDGCTRTCC